MAEGFDVKSLLRVGEREWPRDVEEIYREREEDIMRLVNERRVEKYVFKPSGRVVWIVKGRKRDYQVIPSSNYCSCDDFYFRVISDKKPLCYHLIAQRIAAATGLYKHLNMTDSKYNSVIDRIRLK